jgi:uncharacterized membrane protein SpoIIM required for sporulation
MTDTAERDALTLHAALPDDRASAAAIKTGPLKSAQFRREREAGWRTLENLLAQAEKDGLSSLGDRQLVRLPALYRATLSALSVARSISLDHNLVTYLETLSARAYFQIYGPRQSLGNVVAAFLLRWLPLAIRQLKGPILLSAAILFIGAAAGFALTFANSDWFYAFVDSEMAGGRNPAATTEDLRRTLFDPPPESGFLAIFSSVLFAHNAKITLLCFALGIALGVPTVILLFLNGLTLGAFLALFASHGLGVDMLGWLWIHGTTEITAIILGGGAGCALGRAVLFPDERSRLESLAETGRIAGIVALGTSLLLFIAGFLEGIGRQTINDTPLRFGIGSLMLVFWLFYFNLGRRRKDTAPDGAGS